MGRSRLGIRSRLEMAGSRFGMVRSRLRMVGSRNDKK